MRCRRIVNGNVVWFGSKGKDENDNAIFYNVNDKHDNFASNQQAVADSLTQHLQNLKSELWFDVNYGIPLFDKVKSKYVLDAAISKIVTDNEDVINISEFDSRVEHGKYNCVMTIETVYGTLSNFAIR